ncbi:hypothetical protein BCR44DRAFT_41276 [Catenaria anguillulae PL171]|uniref:Transmembrane protein n=1 Tax=Catenaria anguillulae PL171 TaxID=765915 RepID=A0A1Y2I0Q8_9FUNG|nr:hypothetical protein BCR44DRAFT_41276 [Catenaria anguillulae PL171]
MPALAVPGDIVAIIACHHAFAGALILAQIKAVCRDVPFRSGWPPKAALLAFLMLLPSLILDGFVSLVVSSDLDHDDVTIAMAASLTRTAAVLILTLLCTARASFVSDLVSVVTKCVSGQQQSPVLPSLSMHALSSLPVLLLVVAQLVATVVMLVIDLVYQVAALRNPTKAWVDQSVDWTLHTTIATLCGLVNFAFVAYSEGWITHMLFRQSGAAAAAVVNANDLLTSPLATSNESESQSATATGGGNNAKVPWHQALAASTASSSATGTQPHHQQAASTPGGGAPTAAPVMSKHAIATARFRVVYAVLIISVFFIQLVMLLVALFTDPASDRALAPLDITGWAIILCRVYEFSDEFVACSGPLGAAGASAGTSGLQSSRGYTPLEDSADGYGGGMDEGIDLATAADAIELQQFKTELTLGASGPGVHAGVRSRGVTTGTESATSTTLLDMSYASDMGLVNHVQNHTRQ